MACVHEHLRVNTWMCTCAHTAVLQCFHTTAPVLRGSHAASSARIVSARASRLCFAHHKLTKQEQLYMKPAEQHDKATCTIKVFFFMAAYTRENKNNRHREP